MFKLKPRGQHGLWTKTPPLCVTDHSRLSARPCAGPHSSFGNSLWVPKPQAGPTWRLVFPYLNLPRLLRNLLHLHFCFLPPSPSLSHLPFLVSGSLPPAQSQEVGAEGGSHPELANEQDVVLESTEECGRWAVLYLYEALKARDADRARQLLTPDDIEWWFHGPKEHQRHLISLLSGDEEAGAGGFVFDPQSVAAFGSTVVVEGCHAGVAWVHAWTVGPDGLITQVREYFNTSVTVTRVGDSASSSSSSSSSAAATTCRPVWQSRLPERARKSLPGLVLAI